MTSEQKWAGKACVGRVEAQKGVLKGGNKLVPLALKQPPTPPPAPDTQ